MSTEFDQCALQLCPLVKQGVECCIEIQKKSLNGLPMDIESRGEALRLIEARITQQEYTLTINENGLAQGPVELSELMETNSPMKTMPSGGSRYKHSH